MTAPFPPRRQHLPEGHLLVFDRRGRAPLQPTPARQAGGSWLPRPVPSSRPPSMPTTAPKPSPARRGSRSRTLTPQPFPTLVWARSPGARALSPAEEGSRHHAQQIPFPTRTPQGQVDRLPKCMGQRPAARRLRDHVGASLRARGQGGAWSGRERRPAPPLGRGSEPARSGLPFPPRGGSPPGTEAEPLWSSASPAARPRCSAWAGWALTLVSGTASTPSLNLSDCRRNRSQGHRSEKQTTHGCASPRIYHRSCILIYATVCMRRPS